MVPNRMYEDCDNLGWFHYWASKTGIYSEPFCSLPQIINKASKVRWVEKNEDNWKIEENIRFGDVKFAFK